jgi:hypothetical protein
MSNVGHAFASDNVEPFDDVLVGMDEVPTMNDVFNFDEFLVGTPELPGVVQGADREPLPALPLFSGPLPPVPPKSGYDTLPLPPLPRFTSRPLPVPPKDHSKKAALSTHCPTISPYRHLIGSHLQQQGVRYPHQPLTSVPAYADVEELALDRDERPSCAPTYRDAEATNHTSGFVDIPLPPQNPLEMSMEDVDMDFSPRHSPERQRCLPDRRLHEGCEGGFSGSGNADFAERQRQLGDLMHEKKTKQKPKEPLKGPITIQLVNRHRTRKLAAAVSTARANAGTSGYVPRGQRLTQTVYKAPKPPAGTTDVEMLERRRRLARLRYRKKKKQQENEPVTSGLRPREWEG